MDSTVMITLVFFLVGMAVLAGAGIGFVAGLALGRRGDEPPPAAAIQTADRGAPQPAWAQREAPRPRTPAAWSVALAFGVIILCCACTFLVAVAATLGG